MADIPLDRAYLLALWLETFLFGVYTVIFFTCLYVLFWKRPGRPVWPLVIPTFILYIFAGTHVSIVLVRNITGFTVIGRDKLGGADEYFHQASHPLNVSNQFLYATNNLIGDSVLIWRCWVVWGRRWKVIVVPLLLLCGTAVASYNAAWQFRLSQTGIFNKGLELWGKIFFIFTLTTNVLVTSLIAGRIWYMGRQLNKAMTSGPSSAGGTLPSMGDRYWGVMIIFIESGMLYSSAIVVEMVLFLTHTNAIYILFDAMAQIIGIVPTMIVVLVGLGITQKKEPNHFSTQDSIRFNSNRPAHYSTYNTDGGLTTTVGSVAFTPNARTHRRTGGNARDQYAHRAEVLDLDNLPSARAIQLPTGSGSWQDKDSIEFDMVNGADKKVLQVAKERVSLERRRAESNASQSQYFHEQPTPNRDLNSPV